ncbi:MAG: NAD(+) synthase [Lachnospiraceae bacterium]|nr:NAD(+) synthase [Lachnospiraceae bacterium]
MKDGFIKAAALTPKVRVADAKYNGAQIREMITKAAEDGVQVLVFPELCITGYTCGDLFSQKILLDEAKKQLLHIAKHTTGLSVIVFVGLPIVFKGKLYNVAAAVSGGEVLGLVPKKNIPNYNEFYEKRYFTEGMEEPEDIELEEGVSVPIGTNLLFACTQVPDLKIAAEICEDLWVPSPPSIRHALAGATVIANLSASDEITGKAGYRRDLVCGQSGRLYCGYIYASAGLGESTQDVVYAAHNMIAENGSILAEAKRFANETVVTDLDLERVMHDRIQKTTFSYSDEYYEEIPFDLEMQETELIRSIDPSPFVPKNMADRNERCDEILNIQAMGLVKRLEHTNAKTAVIGISGGLDSTLALLVTVRAFDILGLPREGVQAITMPGFGTTDRTYDNAVSLIRDLGTTFREIPIRDAVTGHFKDIGHDINNHDVTYENSQARERTQILMDVANQCGGMVIGTGDLSELALGWATYNGDHMSMYGVNGSIPKTLVRHLIRYYADTCEDEKLAAVLYDVLDTPVSPELLPPKEGQISQVTEDIVGPYELHDFFLYQVLRFGFSPKKILRLAKIAFDGEYEDETILKWLNTFYRRFFSQQFKRSCLPDGPKVGSVAVSPRGDLRMPSDASSRLWLEELERL